MLSAPALPAAARNLLAPVGVGALACAGCAVVLAADPTTAGNPLPPCPTKALFGVVCPGCGALRMIFSLLHGRLDAAMHFNAVALLALPLLVWAWGAWLVGRAQRRRVRSWQHLRWAPTLTLAVVLVWWVARNIPIGPFDALRV